MPRGTRLKAEDIVGKTYNRLTITNTWRDDTPPYARWVACDCSCGKKNHVARHCNVVSGLARSCGCLSREQALNIGARRRKHGRSHGDPLYSYWGSLKGKGLIGQEWRDFNAFAAAVGPDRPPGYFLLREDLDKPLSPDNNKGWGLPSESRRQGRNARLIKIGNETRLSSEWAYMAGVTRQAFQQWFDKGQKTEQELKEYVYNHDMWRARTYQAVGLALRGKPKIRRETTTS